MSEKTIVKMVKGTGTSLDDAEVVCGPVTKFKEMDENLRIKKIVKLAPLLQYEIVEGENIETFDAHGIWIEEEYLVADFLEELESYIPKKHIRTIAYTIEDYKLSLVEYEDRLQCAFYNNKDNEVRLSCYKDKVHLGSIKYLLEKCSDNKDVEEATELVRGM